MLLISQMSSSFSLTIFLSDACVAVLYFLFFLAKAGAKSYFSAQKWIVQWGGGGTPLYKLYRYVPPQRIGFLRCFGLKRGIDFVHFGLESGMVFEGTTGVYERIYPFNSK